MYIDTAGLIYTAEYHPAFAPLLGPLWRALDAGEVNVVASELAILETLVIPIRTQNHALRRDYEALLFGSSLELLPITRRTLSEGAKLRAQHNLRTANAIHAAAALQAGAALFVTNDADSRRVPGLQVAVPGDLLR